jgi:uncharacterized protein YyaL (SSP411 family)
MFEQFHDQANGGFFQTGRDHETLVVRRKDFIDNAIPSGNALAAESLLTLWRCWWATTTTGTRPRASAC